MENSDAYPADAVKINDLLNNLGDIKTGHLVSQTVPSQKQLLVADDSYNRRIVLTLADDQQFTLYVGTSPNGTASHVRLDGQDEVYLTGALSISQVGAAAASWIDAQYYSVDTATVKTVKLENAAGQFTFNKDSNNAWTLDGLNAGETPSASAINRLVNSASSVRMMRPVGKTEDPTYGLDTPQARIELLTQADDKQQTITLLVGNQDTSDHSYYAKLSSSDYIVKLSETLVGGWIKNTRADFLEPPATPTPES